MSVKYVLTYRPASDFASRARELYPAHQARFQDFHASGLLLMIGTLAGGRGAGHLHHPCGR